MFKTLILLNHSVFSHSFEQYFPDFTLNSKSTKLATVMGNMLASQHHNNWTVPLYYRSTLVSQQREVSGADRRDFRAETCQTTYFDADETVVLITVGRRRSVSALLLSFSQF